MAVGHWVSVAFQSTVHADHVRVDCTGTYSLDAMLELLERIFALVAGAGREAVLVDVRAVTGPEPMMAERYQMAVHIADLQAARQPRIRLAALGHEPLISRERFGEIVATRRGAVARTFTDEALALEWLLGQSAAHRRPDALD